MIRCKEAIVVEGRYDAGKLKQLVDAPIFETSGFAVMNDRALLSLLRRVAQARGLVILTDSDGAGFVIRNYLKGALPKERVLHAYIPDIPGKERRKEKPGKEGKLGVEGMTPEVLLTALKNAGATLSDMPSEAPRGEPVTKTDLYELGLSGHPDSRERRLALQKQLDLPEHLSANALLTALNCMYTKRELEELLWRPESSTSPSQTS